MTIKKAKELVQSVEIAEIDELEKKSRAAIKLDGYKWKEEIVNYGGIKQTWLIVLSEKSKESDLRQLEKQIKKAKERVEKLLKELSKEKFNSPEEARYKLKGINKNLKLFEIREIQVRAENKSKNTENKSKNTETIYQIEGVIHQKTSEIEILRKSAGKFILATHLVDDNKLEPSEILSN